jgi:hypothetical protein
MLQVAYSIFTINKNQISIGTIPVKVGSWNNVIVPITAFSDKKFAQIQAGKLLAQNHKLKLTIGIIVLKNATSQNGQISATNVYIPTNLLLKSNNVLSREKSKISIYFMNFWRLIFNR